MNEPPQRRDGRRRQRTRAALIEAAQELLAGDGGSAVSIQTITDRADVGFGSFYNHFETKTDLFETALAEASQAYETWLDDRLTHETDPIRRLALSIRLTGRLHRTHPRLANLLTRQPSLPAAGKKSLPIRAREDIVAAIAALPDDGRLNHPTDVTVISAAGAIAAVLRTSTELPDDARIALTDALAADILRLLGVADAVSFGILNEPVR